MLIDQLTKIYLKKETWHKNKLTEEQSNEYHEKLMINGNILTYIKSGELIGYLEFWRINYEQLGRLICGQPILTDVEDLLSGNIAYINNMFIDSNHRNGDAFEFLASMFLSRNKDAELFVTFRPLKHNKPIQVYRREELIKLYTKGI